MGKRGLICKILGILVPGEDRAQEVNPRWAAEVEWK